MHKFLTNSLIEDATLSILTGEENAQFPISNLLIPITSKVFRSTGNSVDIFIDTNTIAPVDTFALVGDNKVGLGVDTVIIRGSTTPDFSASTAITIDLNDEYNFGFKTFTEATFRYWKVSITSSVYCELSNIYLGKSVDIETNNLSLGTFEYNMKENIKINKNKYGIKFINKYNDQKSMSGVFQLLNDTEYTLLKDVYNEHKNNTPLFFILCPSAELGTDSEYEYSGFFYITSKISFKNTNPGLWSASLELEEVT